jgi:ubiquitin C-terminal hydrolase
MKQCEKIKGFQNIGNSCYMDCVLFILFVKPNTFIQKHILQSRKSYIDCNDNQNIIKDFQKVFKQIIDYFQGETIEITSCQSLKLLISKYRKICPILNIYPNFSNNLQHEALEFLQFIMTLFGLNGMKNVGNHLEFEKRFGVSSSKDKIQWLEWFKHIDKKSSIIYFVDHDNFNKPHKNIKRFINKKDIVYNLEDTKYKKCIVNTSEEKQHFIQYSDFFIVAIDRINPFTGNVLHSKVKIDLNLTSTLHLDAIIIHIGETKSSGHYICFKKYKNVWLFYDDLSLTIKIFKSWSEVLKFRKNIVEKQGVLFFYTC